MASDDQYKEPFIDNDKDDDESGSGTSGGQGGSIEFVDFTQSLAGVRDDLLPQDEKHLLTVHKDVHESKVKQQKEKLDHYKDLKNGKITLAAHRAGLAGNGSQYKANPALVDKAQFSGIDKQVIGLPTESLDETNPELRNELENQLRYTNQPRFNPRPQGG